MLLPSSPVTDPQTTRTSLAGVLGLRGKREEREREEEEETEDAEALHAAARTTSTHCITPAHALGSPVTSDLFKNRAATAGTRWRCLANHPALKIPVSRSSSSLLFPCSTSLAEKKSSAAPARGSAADTLLQGGRCAERRYSATGCVASRSPRRATRAKGGVATSGGYESMILDSKEEERRRGRGRTIGDRRSRMSRCASSFA